MILKLAKYHIISEDLINIHYTAKNLKTECTHTCMVGPLSNFLMHGHPYDKYAYVHLFKSYKENGKFTNLKVHGHRHVHIARLVKFKLS